MQEGGILEVMVRTNDIHGPFPSECTLKSNEYSKCTPAKGNIRVSLRNYYVGVLTLSFFISQRILTSLKVRMQASSDCDTLGIFLSAARLPLRGLCTDLNHDRNKQNSVN